MTEVFTSKHLVVLARDGWEYAERKKGKSAVAVLARTADGRVIFTEQYRRPVDARVIDWPAGLVGDEDDGPSDPAETAKKELEEETGYVCERVELLANGPTSPGITSETVALFGAQGVERRGEGGGVGGEEIDVHAVPLDAVENWLKRKQGEGVLVDLKVWAGLYFLMRG